MYQLLTNKYSNYIVMAGMLLMVYIAYVFSFRQTIEAIRLNNQLTLEKTGDKSLDVPYEQIENQHLFYVNAVKDYHVRTEDRENRLWQAISGIALNKDVGISFNPTLLSVVDTTATKNGMVKQHFTFKGKYFNVLKLLDSIDKTDGIGRISDLKLMKNNIEEPNKASKDLKLQVTMAAIAK